MTLANTHCGWGDDECASASGSGTGLTAAVCTSAWSSPCAEADCSPQLSARLAVMSRPASTGDDAIDWTSWRCRRLPRLCQDTAGSSRVTREAADAISCVEFSDDGDLLATGDKAGRVVVFQREPPSKASAASASSDYNVYSTFQSHEPEFDYLKSLEIEEKINRVKWLRRKNPANFLLSTNDKTIKLWKLTERERRVADGQWNLRDDATGAPRRRAVTPLRVPLLEPMQLVVEASPRRVYANAHSYHINSISVNSDLDTFMSADDLRINLWHLEITNQSFNIVDIKPANMEELTEVITAAEFHPRECHVMAYASSKGSVRYCDMRLKALCDQHAKSFEEPDDPANRSFFSEIISSISDVRFSHSGRYLLARDYLSVKVWDSRMERRPVQSYRVHEHLRSKLCALYENDCIFDKFECGWSADDRHICTGSYHNLMRTFDRANGGEQTLEACTDVARPRVLAKPGNKHQQRAAAVAHALAGRRRNKDELSADALDYTKKVLHVSWHPTEAALVVAATNNLYIFHDHP